MHEEVSHLGNEFEAPLLTRKQLLPLWIKIFCWFFVVMGAFSLLGVFLAVLDVSFQLSFFGLETNDGGSLTGIILLAMFLLKGFVAIGLLGHQKWAADLAIADAVLGIIVCVATNIIIVMGGKFTLRLEIIFLGLYLWKMLKIREGWKLSPQ